MPRSKHPQKASNEDIEAYYKKIIDKSNQMGNYVCELFGKNFRLMFEDEAGFGRTNKPKRCWCTKGIRPNVPIHRVREYMQAYGAVSPLDGQMVSLVFPKSNTNCMNIDTGLL
jgi:hypothetical protein